jgi:hypothetical protein
MTHEIHGFCDERFRLMEEAFRANFDEGLELGASLALTWRGRTVVDLLGRLGAIRELNEHQTVYDCSEMEVTGFTTMISASAATHLELAWFQSIGERLIKSGRRCVTTGRARRTSAAFSLDGSSIVPGSFTTGRAPFYFGGLPLLLEMDTATVGVKAIWTGGARTV